MPDELLESFDKTMMAMKLNDEMDQKTKRSEIVRELMEEWIEDHREHVQGNYQSTIQEGTNSSQSKMSS